MKKRIRTISDAEELAAEVAIGVIKQLHLIVTGTEKAQLELFNPVPDHKVMYGIAVSLEKAWGVYARIKKTDDKPQEDVVIEWIGS